MFYNNAIFHVHLTGEEGGLTTGAIAGISIVAIVIVAILIAVCVYFFVIKGKRMTARSFGFFYLCLYDIIKVARVTKSKFWISFIMEYVLGLGLQIPELKISLQSDIRLLRY